MDIWIWNWQSGGYNWCRASSKEDALKQANEMGARCALKATKMRKGTIQDVEKLDRQYASMFY